METTSTVQAAPVRLLLTAIALTMRPRCLVSVLPRPAAVPDLDREYARAAMFSGAIEGFHAPADGAIETWRIES